VFIVVTAAAEDSDTACADADAPAAKKRRVGSGDVEKDDDYDECGAAEAPMVGFLNPACTTVTYHSETMEERVALTMVLPSGCNHVHIDYNAAGTYALISLRWPPEMVDVDLLYEDELKAKKMISYHPLLMALKRALANHTEVLDRVPSTVISVKLPAPVVTTDGADKKVFFSKTSGTMVLIATMKCKNNSFVAVASKRTLSNFNAFAQ